MKTIRIRKFTFVSLLLISLLPWTFFVMAHVIETKSFRFEMTESQKNNMDEAIRLIETNTENWSNKSWQYQLSQYLRDRNIGVSIVSESNKEIFQSEPSRNRKFEKTEQFSIIQDGRLLGKVILYQTNSMVIQMIAAFIGFILAIFLIGLMMRRFILNPLEKLGKGARKIAEGDFDIQLPSSRITEIANVSDGFKIMISGLTESFQKQVELEHDRRFVITAVAHDLRTPLFALRGYLDGLEQGVARSPEKIAKYVAVCKEKSVQLDRLVEDLFTFTKMDYLEMKLNVDSIDFSKILKQSINTIRMQADQKLILIVEKVVENNCWINGDSHLLERAVMNLLDNAVRHTPREGEIFVQCKRENDRVIFSIKDTGRGFSSEELRHVFEPLYRGEKSRNRSTGGAGLGLTIAQRIIIQHGGNLSAGNHSDGGAHLEGWIPLATK